MRSIILKSVIVAAAGVGVVSWLGPTRWPGVSRAVGQGPVRVTPELARVMDGAGQAERVPVLVELVRVDAPRPLATTSDLRAAEQASNLAQLYSGSAAQLRTGVSPSVGAELQFGRLLWVGGALAAELTAAEVQELAARPDIRRIYYDGLVPVDLAGPSPQPHLWAAGLPVAAQAPWGGLPWGLQEIGAPELWASGATGRGATVAIIDSGVDGQHPLLRRSWRGLTTAAAHAWFDPWGLTMSPEDDDGTAGIGHGTIVATVAVGHLMPGDTLVSLAGAQQVSDELEVVTGVAPGAEWVAVNAFERFGTGTYTRRSVLLQAMQWALDPDGDPMTVSDVPDVVNNSWGFSPGGCDGFFDRAIDALELAGIPVVFAAGNRGAGFDTVASPADRADLLLNAFAVGAATQRDGEVVVADNSLGGPSSCAPGAVKPEVVAPGAIPLIRPLGANRAEVSGRSGAFTSWAAPHAAGALAVLSALNPDAGADRLKGALYSTARDLPPLGPDNRSGAGLIDLPGAAARIGGLGGVRLALASWRWDSIAATLTINVRNQGAGDFPGGEAQLLEGKGRAAVAAAPAPFIPALGTGLLEFRDLPDGLAEGSPLRLVLLSGDAELDLGVALRSASASAVSLEAGGVSLALDGNGRLGRVAGTPGFGFSGGDWLTGGAFLIAEGERVSDAAYVDVLQRPGLKANPVGSDTDWRAIQVSAGGSSADVSFDDRRALQPLDATVTQGAELRSIGDSAAFVVIRTALQLDGQPATRLAGLLLDWDLAERDSVAWDPGLRASVMTAADSGGPWFALTSASRPVTTHAAVALGTPENGLYRAGRDAGVLSDLQGFTDGAKARLMTLGGPAASRADVADWAQMIAVGPVTSGEVVTFLVAAGRTRQALRVALDRARASVPSGGETQPADVADGLELLPPYPNPFDPTAGGLVRFPFLVRRGETAVRARLDIYAISGQLVYRERRTLSAGVPLEPFQWDGMLANGEAAASGVYGYVIRVGGQRRSGKFVLLK